jgi:transposase
MLQSGGRWRDCPAEYGPHTTIYNRFNRRSREGNLPWDVRGVDRQARPDQHGVD